MKNLIFNFLLLILILFHYKIALSQRDFNNFTSSQSAGKIPEDFSSYTFEKIQTDLTQNKRDLKKSKEKIFLENIHYGIDAILHSGLVIYGDEISSYVNSVADKLLEKDKTLRSNLRFYTIKSNVSNAFSTDQGIIFITTGLISQLTSESQLALILAHEISHYTEKHVVESFELSTKNTQKNIIDLSIYSKENELEADIEGLEMYKKAGYSKDDILSTFDVIMYSYLPFEEIEVPLTYFNTSDMFIPTKLFPSKKYEISAIEDYDDSESSHPNIKKRKDAVSVKIENAKDWGTTSYFLGKDKFLYIRNICRFESVRTDILNSNYGNAIYSIFVLEKEFNNSIFLQRMKAQAWLGLAQYKENGTITKTIDKSYELEGEIAAIHYFIKKLNKDGVFTLALRQVYDLKQKNPNDKQIDAIYNYLIKELAFSKNFKLEKYSSKNFNTSANESINNINTNPEVLEEKKSKNKYEKIKSKKNANNPNNFDSTKFYFYGIPDIINDDNFKKLYSNYNDELIEDENKKEEYDKLTDKEQKKIDKKTQNEQLYIDLKDVIIVEPMVFSFRNNELNRQKSEKLKNDFANAITEAAEQSGVKTFTIDRSRLNINGTESYNERNTLFNFISQISQEDNFNIFPVDYELLENIKNNHSASKVMFSIVEHYNNSKINFWSLYLAMGAYPILPVYLPYMIMTSHMTDITVIILDLDASKIETGTSYYSDDTPKKYHLGAHMFNLFEKLKKSKN